MQAIKETFDEEKVEYRKEIERVKDKAQRESLNYETDLDKLKKQVVAKATSKSATKIVKKVVSDDVEKNNAKDLFSTIMTELKEKQEHNESKANKVDFEEQLKKKEQEHKGQMAKMKTELKHSFNVEMQNMRLINDRQLRQQKVLRKKQEQDIDALKHELVKKDAEIALLKEQNKHFENGRIMYSEQFEFLSRVIILINNR